MGRSLYGGVVIGKPPGSDFLVLRPSANLRDFCAKPAKWADACRAVQAALILSGSAPADAVAFRMHSFRHVYPTMVRQLLIPDSIVAIMSHWTSKDPMPGVYDCASANTELVYKSYVRDCYIDGWRLAPYGSLPQQAPRPMNVPKAEVPTIKPVLAASEAPPTCFARLDGKPLRKGAAVQLELASCLNLPEMVVQVVNLKTDLVHLYKSENLSVCSAFKCGDPDNCH